MRILIIEDEKRLAETLADILTRNGDRPDVCHDGISGLDGALSGIYDAVVLDVMLPGLDGFSLLRRLRAAKNATPVLMLTARSEQADKVEGLDLGADYYLTKPFETQELLACLRAITRRGEPKPDALAFGDLVITPGTSELACGGRSVRLGAKELALMRLLLANTSRLLSKEAIYLKIWGYDGEAEDSIVEVYLSFLRRKLAHIGSAVKITVVRRVGYRLEPGGA